MAMPRLLSCSAVKIQCTLFDYLLADPVNWYASWRHFLYVALLQSINNTRTKCMVIQTHEKRFVHSEVA